MRPQKLEGLEILERMPTGVGIYDVDADYSARLIYLNDGYYRMIGSRRGKRARYAGYHVLDPICRDDLPAVRAGIRGAVDRNRPMDLHFRLLFGDGLYHWIGLRAVHRKLPEGSFRFYGDGMSLAVARVIEAVDRERQALARAFGFDLLSEPVVSQRQQYGPTDDYLTCYRDSEIFGPLVAPNTLDHRYMHEDVGEGLITWLALGEVAGVALPAVEALVTLAETVTGRDYRAQKAQRLERLGLTQQTLTEMLNFVLTG